MNSFINHGLIDQFVGSQDYCYLVQKLISYNCVFTNKNKSLHCTEVHSKMESTLNLPKE